MTIGEGPNGGTGPEGSGPRGGTGPGPAEGEAAEVSGADWPDPIRVWTKEEVRRLFAVTPAPVVRQLTGAELWLLAHTVKVYRRYGYEAMVAWGVLGSGHYDVRLRCPAHEYPLRYWSRAGKLECPALSCPYWVRHRCEQEGVPCDCDTVRVPDYFWMGRPPGTRRWPEL